LVRVALSTIFLSGLNVVTGAGIFQISFLLMAITYVMMVIANRNTGITKGILGLFYLLLAISILSALLTSRTYGSALDRLLPILLNVVLATLFLVYYYSAFLLAGGRVRSLFTEYLKVATFFATLGILQLCIFIFLRIDIFDFLARGAKNYGTYLGIAGLSVEPAFYAIALLPAGAYHLSRLVWGIRPPLAGVVCIAAIVFSTSSLGYLGLAVAALLSLVPNRRRGIHLSRIRMLFVTVPLLAAGFVWLFQQEFFRLRWADTMAWLTNGEPSKLFATNISTHALSVNASITFESIRDNVFGAGFGIYEVVFDYYIGGYEVDRAVWLHGLPGSGSAASLFLRLTAELGLFAWVLIAWCTVQFVRGVRNGTDPYIATAYLATYLVILIRMGEYYANGVMLVLLMAYFIGIESRDDRESSGVSARSKGDDRKRQREERMQLADRRES
jgi:hypothetical protein